MPGILGGEGLRSVAGYLDWLWFSCGGAGRGEGVMAILRDFFASANKFFILTGSWALGYHSMGFRHFPNIS